MALTPSNRNLQCRSLVGMVVEVHMRERNTWILAFFVCLNISKLFHDMDIALIVDCLCDNRTSDGGCDR
jgi:hypothetical protein